MTLIVTRTSCRYALMVTDRKVTTNGAEYDPDANKNILFGDRNAVVAIGYTGMAYIGTVPTDQWIAQALTGLTFPQGLRTTFSCVFEGFSRELSSHYIINTNCNALYSPIHYRKVANM